MLRPITGKTGKIFRAGGNSAFAIVASKYNLRYVNGMLRAASVELRKAGAKAIRVVRVPGAYEVPVVASRLARAAASKNGGTTLAAIICLGVIIRGETSHANHIGEAVSRALMDIQLRYEIPVIHEVLLLNDVEQARVRCLGTTHNRGTEAAQTALEMAAVMSRLGEEITSKPN